MQVPGTDFVMSDLQWEADGAEYWAIADLKNAPFFQDAVFNQDISGCITAPLVCLRSKDF